MARQRFEQLPQERQERILSVAAAAFAKSGFAGTSYNRLLAELGFGKGSAYYYFEDKQDLFLTVVTSCYRRFFENLGGVARPTTSADYWTFVEAAVRRGMEFMSDDPTSAALMQCFTRERMMLDVLSSAELSANVEAYYGEWLRLGQKLGAVRRDVPFELLSELARSLSSTFDQWFISRESGATPARIAKLTRTFSGLLRALLEPPPAAGEAPPKRGRDAAGRSR